MKPGGGDLWAASGTLEFSFVANDQATGVIRNIAGEAQNLAGTTNTAKTSTDSLNLAFVAQMEVVRSLYMGFRRTIWSLEYMGVINKKTAASFQKIQAAMGLVIGTFQLYKGAINIIRMLRTEETVLAGVETYRSVLNNPKKMALVMTGLGVAAGAVGFLAGRYGAMAAPRSTVQQTVNFEHQSYDMSGQRAAARDFMVVAGG